MNTNRTRIIRRIAATAAVAGTLTAGPLVGSASASDTSQSGFSVGVHADASTFCQNYPERNLTSTPKMGTSRGWEAGQTVGWRYNVYNVGTGRFVVQESAWRFAYVATRHVYTNLYGQVITTIDPYATLPATTWRLAPGKYLVLIQYAWQTGGTWSYATSMTMSYTNNYVFLGLWRYYTANTCDIDVVPNR